MQARVYRLPPGHASPEHRRDLDRIIVHVAGEVSWSIGGQRHRPRPFDAFVLPAGMHRSVMNAGVSDVLFIVCYEREAPAVRPPDRLDSAFPYLDWEQSREQISYPDDGGAERFGLHRGTLPPIESTNMTGHHVRVPSGQGDQWRRGSGETILIGLQGELEVYADSKAYSLGPLDLMVPPPLLAGPQNVGFEDGLYFTIETKATAATSREAEYYEPAIAGDPLAGPAAK